jgi:enoyl-[acyl-carrier protein] reductase III
MNARPWALILGVSGGLGGATARSLARRGYDIFGVHLDTAERLDAVEALAADLRGHGARVELANINAANESAMREAVTEIAELTSPIGGVRVLLHSLAFGALGPLIRTSPGAEIVTPRQMQMTLSVMAHSLVSWVQALWDAELLRRGAHVLALTSIGSTSVVPSYGAVSAAKSALEAHVRQLAFELAPHGVAVNAIRAGVTETPAFLKIPGSEELKERALRYNPHGRLTTPEDVGEAIALLVGAGSSWMTGNVIGVDGGEKLTL